MSKVVAGAEWFAIVTSPIIALVIWFGDDGVWLRSAATLWLITFVLNCMRARAGISTEFREVGNR